MKEAYLDALCPKCGDEIEARAEERQGVGQFAWYDRAGLHVHQPESEAHG
jgi:hypothetical protein